VRRNLAASGSRAARIRVLAASCSGAAGLIALLVLGTRSLRALALSAGPALLGGRLRAARVRGARLVPAVHLLGTGAAGLIFAISGGAATIFGVICHQIAPGKPAALHFVRARRPAVREMGCRCCNAQLSYVRSATVDASSALAAVPPINSLCAKSPGTLRGHGCSGRRPRSATRDATA